MSDAIALIAEERRAPNALIIIGPRGVGKSVMLDEVARRAQEQYGWVRIHVQMDAGSALAVAMNTAVVVTIDEGQDASKEEWGSFGTFGQEITAPSAST